MRNVICIHKIFYIIQQTYKEVLCVGFWVIGFKVKVDQDKSSLYLNRASSLVLTNSWPQEAREMRVGVGGHAGPWAETGLTTASKLSSTSSMLESRPVGHVFNRNRRLDIYVQSTGFNVSNFFFQKNQWEWNLHNDVLESASVGFYLWPRLGSRWGQRGI